MPCLQCAPVVRARQCSTLGVVPTMVNQNNMQEQLNRIERYLAAQQPSAPAPSTGSACTAAQGKGEVGHTGEHVPAPGLVLDLLLFELEALVPEIGSPDDVRM